MMEPGIFILADTLGVQWWREWDGLGVWVSRWKLLHLEWISNKALLLAQGTDPISWDRP